MNTRLLFLTAALSVALAAPALAQPLVDRQANFDTRVDAALRDRELTVGEAAQLRADFKALINLEAQYRQSGNTISINERADLDNRYEGLVDRIPDDRVGGGRGGPFGGRGDSINERQEELDDRIDAGVRDRSLTNAEAAQLRAEFQSLVRLEATYRASSGLSQAERDDLDRRFDTLSARIRDNRTDEDRMPGIDERQADLDARIDAGVRERSLTNAEAAQLRSEFQALVRLEANYRASGGVISQAERDDLNRRFDALSARIRNDRTDNDTGGQPLDQRRAQLNNLVEAAIRSGRANPREAIELRTEYQAISRLHTQYAADGRYTNAERDELNRRYDALELRVRVEAPGNPGNNDSRWANLAQRQATFVQRLDRAVADGRVTVRQSQDLKVEFDGIARLEASYRRSAPGFTTPERNDINARFDRMEQRFRTVINAGRYGGQYTNLWDYLISAPR